MEETLATQTSSGERGEMISSESKYFWGEMATCYATILGEDKRRTSFALLLCAPETLR